MDLSVFINSRGAQIGAPEIGGKYHFTARSPHSRSRIGISHLIFRPCVGLEFKL
jgi:hypothetical protein